VAGPLSSKAWADICAAAGRAPDAGTRERLSTILFEEYPAFAYDRERVKAALRQGELMLKHLDAFAKEYRPIWLPRLSEDQAGAIFTGRASAVLTDKSIERDCWAIAKLRQRAEGLWLFARAIRRAHVGKKSVQHEWLYHRLCTIWLDHFHAPDLRYSRAHAGGDPYGPLIAFMLLAMRQIMPEAKLPAPETVSDGIDRERRERENAKQLYFSFLARRSRMVD
jgi:hypothetical protein